MNAIFYKEWIKTRWYLLLALLVTLGFAGYSMLRINRVASMKGVEHVWEVMLAPGYRIRGFTGIYSSIGRDTACSGTIRTRNAP